MTTFKRSACPAKTLAAVALVMAAFVFLWSGQAQADPIPGLFNTGVDSNGALLSGGNSAIDNRTYPDGVDPHYTITYSNDPYYTGAAPSLQNPAGTVAINNWQAYLSGWYNYYLNTNSSWIAPVAYAAVPSQFMSFGNLTSFTYTTTFTLGPNLLPATAEITGKVAADDRVTISLNGHTVATVGTVYDATTKAWVNPWRVLTDFSIDQYFQPGLNTLTFQVTNYRGPTGLLVQMSGTAVDPPVPLPASLLLFGPGLAGLAAVRKRFHK